MQGTFTLNALHDENLIHQDDELVIENISNCITDKLSILNIKLPQLAKDADLDYFTLRKIVNQEIGYMPNLRILIKLASYLNIKVGDLLNYSDLPQYIPILSKTDIFDFLSDKINVYGFENTVFNEKYIHAKAFAVKETCVDLIIPTEIVYLCYPNPNIILVVGNVYLCNLHTTVNANFVFGRLQSISSDDLKMDIASETKFIEKHCILAIVVGMQVSETLI